MGSTIHQVMEKLAAHAVNFSKIGKRKIVLAAWCKHPVNPPGDTLIFDADTVLF